MPKRTCLVLVLGLLLALPALSQGNPTGKLTGRVTADGEPLPGVRVTVTSPNLQNSPTFWVTGTNGVAYSMWYPAGYNSDEMTGHAGENPEASERQLNGRPRWPVTANGPTSSTARRVRMPSG